MGSPWLHSAQHPVCVNNCTMKIHRILKIVVLTALCQNTAASSTAASKPEDVSWQLWLVLAGAAGFILLTMVLSAVYKRLVACISPPPTKEDNDLESGTRPRSTQAGRIQGKASHCNPPKVPAKSCLKSPAGGASPRAADAPHPVIVVDADSLQRANQSSPDTDNQRSPLDEADGKSLASEPGGEVVEVQAVSDTAPQPMPEDASEEKNNQACQPSQSVRRLRPKKSSSNSSSGGRRGSMGKVTTGQKFAKTKAAPASTKSPSPRPATAGAERLAMKKSLTAPRGLAMASSTDASQVEKPVLGKALSMPKGLTVPQTPQSRGSAASSEKPPGRSQTLKK